MHFLVLTILNIWRLHELEKTIPVALFVVASGFPYMASGGIRGEGRRQIPVRTERTKPGIWPAILNEYNPDQDTGGPYSAGNYPGTRYGYHAEQNYRGTGWGYFPHGSEVFGDFVHGRLHTKEDEKKLIFRPMTPHEEQLYWNEE